MKRGYLRNRSKLRRGISNYPLSQRRRLRSSLLSSQSSSLGDRYTKLRRYAAVSDKKRQSLKDRLKPSVKTRDRIAKMAKSKTLRNGLLASATIGTLLTVLPKETLSDAADTVQKFGENVYNMAEDMGDTTGSLIRVIGSSADTFANGLGFLSDHFGTLMTVGVGGWFASKLI